MRSLAILVLFTISACASSPARPLELPAPVELATLGPGDVFELRLVGEDKLPVTFTVSPDGTVDLPYLQRLQASGLEPQQLVDKIRAQLMERYILSNPGVSVLVKEYNSKRIEVLGEVQKPGSLPMQPGMTLVRAISLSGGFNSIANKDKVTVRRRVKGGTRADTISVDDIMRNRIPDPMLQAGDSVNVAQRIM